MICVFYWFHAFYVYFINIVVSTANVFFKKTKTLVFLFKKQQLFFEPRKTRQKGKEIQKKKVQKSSEIPSAFGRPKYKQGLSAHE